MNKGRVERMIPAAMTLLKGDSDIVEKSSGKIPSRYNGYIASFGPCVVQAGLLQTLAFFSRADRDEREDVEGRERKRIVYLMEKTLASAGYLKDMKGADLYAMACGCPDAVRRTRFKSLVLEASVACKLAMRTFPKKDED
jgi:hypothetical protein